MTILVRIALAGLGAAAICCAQPAPVPVFSGRMHGRAGTLYQQLWRLAPRDRKVQLSRTTRHHHQPSCGADARELLFLAGGAKQTQELWKLDVKTGAEQMLLKTDEDQPISRVLGWSRDKRQVILVLAAEGGHHLAKLLMEDKSLAGLTRAESAVLSPDGTRIAYDTSYVGGGSLAQSQLVVVDLDGKPVAHLGRGAKPAWSPDGEKLAALIVNGTDLQFVEVRTRNIQRTVSLPPKSDRWASVAALSWSPDGTRLLASSPAGDEENYWLLNLETREWTYLDQGRGARWAPQGAQLVYSAPPKQVKVERKEVTVSALRLAEAPEFRPREVSLPPALVEGPAWCVLEALPLR